MSGVILAFDHGQARIGVATGNALTQTATPLVTLTARAGAPSWLEVDRLVADWHPTALIVGEPSAPEVRAAVAHFVHELRVRYKLPLHTVDETLTSRAAESDLKERRRRGGRRTRKTDVDSHAACLIAEQWMRRASAPGSDVDASSGELS